MCLILWLVGCLPEEPTQHLIRLLAPLQPRASQAPNPGADALMAKLRAAGFDVLAQEEDQIGLASVDRTTSIFWRSPRRREGRRFWQDADGHGTIWAHASAALIADPRGRIVIDTGAEGWVALGGPRASALAPCLSAPALAIDSHPDARAPVRQGPDRCTLEGPIAVTISPTIDLALPGLGPAIAGQLEAAGIEGRVIEPPERAWWAEGHEAEVVVDWIGGAPPEDALVLFGVGVSIAWVGDVPPSVRRAVRHAHTLR